MNRARSPFLAPFQRIVECPPLDVHLILLCQMTTSSSEESVFLEPGRVGRGRPRRRCRRDTAPRGNSEPNRPSRPFETWRKEHRLDLASASDKVELTARGETRTALRAALSALGASSHQRRSAQLRKAEVDVSTDGLCSEISRQIYSFGRQSGRTDQGSISSRTSRRLSRRCK